MKKYFIISYLFIATSVAFAQDSSGVPKKKSPVLAAALSFVVPGVGEAYAGSFSSSGKYFLLAEGLLLVSGITSNLYGLEVQSASRAYAHDHAGANGTFDNDAYYFAVGNYSSREEYNEEQARLATPQRMYTDPAYDWRWSAVREREKYQSQRLKSAQLLNISDLLFTALVVNHIASAINAGLAAGRRNKNLSLGVVPDRDLKTLNLSLRYSW